MKSEGVVGYSRSNRSIDVKRYVFERVGQRCGGQSVGRLWVRSGQVWGHTAEQRVAASTLSGTPSASVWPSPRQTPGPPCPYTSDRTPPDATMKPVGGPSAWSSYSDREIRGVGRPGK